MPANPLNPEEGLEAAPVSGAPEHMLELRIVPVGTLGVKEELDETKRLVVKYDPYMQVVNGMLGSSAGNMHRLGELLRDAVDGTAQGQFAEAIKQADSTGYQGGYADAQTDGAGKAAVLGERIEFLEKENSDFERANEAYRIELEGAGARIQELEKELAEATKPAAQRAHSKKDDDKDNKD